jgi:hypothetical protein
MKDLSSMLLGMIFLRAELNSLLAMQPVWTEAMEKLHPASGGENTESLCTAGGLACTAEGLSGGPSHLKDQPQNVRNWCAKTASRCFPKASLATGFSNT